MLLRNVSPQLRADVEHAPRVGTGVGSGDGYIVGGKGLGTTGGGGVGCSDGAGVGRGDGAIVGNGEGRGVGLGVGVWRDKQKHFKEGGNAI